MVTGPPGLNRCVLLAEYYNSYQWATCLTDQYIEAKTGKRFHCQIRTAVYCWYQCMVEAYESMGPNVTGVCACNPNDTARATVAPSGVTLPPDCFSPNGTDCTWYSRCLEAKYPCAGTSAGFAVEYATAFCALYSKHLADYSAVGQLWVAATRKCLQTTLVPLLRQYWTPTCADIRTLAFQSYAPCYQTPDSVGAPSVCSLPLSDFFAIMFTVKGEFDDPLTASESICAGVDVFRGCSRQWQATRPCLRSAVIALDILAHNNDPGSSALDAAVLSANLTDQIAKLMRWGDLSLRFLGCITDWLQNDTSYLNVVVATPDYVACLKNQQSPTSKRAVSSTNMDDVMRDFQNAVRNGSLLLQVNGVTAYVSAFGECDPMTCSGVTATNITAPPAPGLTTHEVQTTQKVASMAVDKSSAPPVLSLSSCLLVVSCLAEAVLSDVNQYRAGRW